MANPPPSSTASSSAAAPGAPNATPTVTDDQDMATPEQLVLNLCNPELREKALYYLSRKEGNIQNLGPLLWHSFGTITVLLQEIVSIYPSLSPPTLSQDRSNRVYDALVLLQCVATNADTRPLFLAAQIPLYIYPFLNTLNKARQYNDLRTASLVVIGALVKDDDPEAVAFLLGSEIIPLCLRAMEIGSDIPKSLATVIVRNIMLHNSGLHYVCASVERYLAVVSVLAQMVESAERPSPRLLRHILRCYLSLTHNARACSLLHKHLPISFRNGTLNKYFQDTQDDAAMLLLWQLVHKVNIASRGFPHTAVNMTGM